MELFVDLVDACDDGFESSDFSGVLIGEDFSELFFECGEHGCSGFVAGCSYIYNGWVSKKV